jgi:hypothetical protein
LANGANLASLGNEHVKNYINFPHMVEAARIVSKASTGKPPNCMQELYGSRAMDILWSSEEMMGGVEFDLPSLYDIKPGIRVTTFTTGPMFQDKLVEIFGRTVSDYSLEVANTMQQTLRNDYSSCIGVFDLYQRSAGTEWLVEMLELIDFLDPIADDHVLLVMLHNFWNTKINEFPNLNINRKLKRKLNSKKLSLNFISEISVTPIPQQPTTMTQTLTSSTAQQPATVAVPSTLLPLATVPLISTVSTLSTSVQSSTYHSEMSYELFYHIFLENYINSFHSKRFKEFMSVLVIDQSGTISWMEIEINAKWAILMYEEDCLTWDLGRLIRSLWSAELCLLYIKASMREIRQVTLIWLYNVGFQGPRKILSGLSKKVFDGQTINTCLKTP